MEFNFRNSIIKLKLGLRLLYKMMIKYPYTKKSRQTMNYESKIFIYFCILTAFIKA